MTGTRRWPSLDRVLAFQERLECAGSVEDVAAEMAAGIRQLLPAHIASVDEAAPAEGWAWCMTSPTSAFVRDQEPFELHMHEHPLLAHYQHTNELGACRISDFLTQRTYRSTGLYGGVFRHVGTEDVLAVALPTRNPRASAVVALQRSGPFLDHERDLLDRLRPSLAAALRHAEVREQLAMVAAGWRSVSSHVLAFGDVSRRRPSAVEAILREAWPDWNGEGPPAALAMAVDQWRSSPGSDPVRIRVERPRLRLEIDVRGHAGSECWLAVRAWGRATSALADAGLTMREIEVVGAVADGATNAEIGARLFISQHTVKKHLEHVYDKLGVRTRAGVAAIAARNERSSSLTPGNVSGAGRSA